MGTPEFAVEPLRALLDSGYDVASVVTVPDKPSGRGCKVNESAVKKFALERGLPLLQPEKLKDENFIASLKATNADLFVVVAFRMLPEVVWSMPRLGTFNLHASLLPQYRGAAPINWAIINGEKRTGVTTFMLDKAIDTGGILLQEECAIGDDENIGELYDRLMVMGSNLLLRTVKGLEDGSLKPQPQRCDEGVELKAAPKITKETCRIDWKAGSEHIWHLVKGLSPYPAAWSTLASESKSIDVKIFQVHPYTTSDRAERLSQMTLEPGNIQSDGKSFLRVATGNGLLDIEQLQLAGKRRMSVKEFLMGFRDIDQFRFE